MTLPTSLSNKRGFVGALAAAVALATPVIAHFEGDVPVGYADVGGVPTACYGHTGAGVVVGKRYSPAQCDAWRHGDVGIAASGVERCITRSLTTNQWAAFTVTAYNLGVAAFCRSSIAKLANAGDMPRSCVAISKFIYAGGRIQPGLVKRRAAERAMCEGTS